MTFDRRLANITGSARGLYCPSSQKLTKKALHESGNHMMLGSQAYPNPFSIVRFSATPQQHIIITSPDT